MEESRSFVPGDGKARAVASTLLAVDPGRIVEVGAGETFLCWGTAETVVLLPRRPTEEALEKLRLIAACSATARTLEVRTPDVVRVESDPLPHAICERVHAVEVEDEPRARAAVYEELGRQLAALHRAGCDGAGAPAVTNGRIRGRSKDWKAHCEDFIARLVLDDSTDQRAATVRSFGNLDRSHWEALADMIRDHANRKPVLCHYDNRLPNLPVDNVGVWVLDWDLARIAPLSHELIKLYERPSEQARADATALLSGYGIARELHADVMRDALTALAMDGLAMSVDLVDEPSFHGGIKAWLTTIRRVVTNTEH